jgi:hypothetical protein
MLEFLVSVEIQRRRHYRVAAPDADAARADLRDVLPEGARIVDCRVAGSVGTRLARRAMRHILTRDFLPLSGDAPATVEDWLFAARDAAPAGVDAINLRLASAGLRLRPDGAGALSLACGSAHSIPALARWCRGQPFAGSTLLAALAELPRALRCNMTISGLRTRAISMPLQDWLDYGGDDA